MFPTTVPVSLFAVLALSASFPTGNCFGQAAPAMPLSGVRNWTTTEGKAFQATFVRVQGPTVWLKLTNGQVATLPIARLSEADQALVKPPAAAPLPATPPISPKPAAPVLTTAAKRGWPPKVEVDNRAIEVKLVKEDAANQKYVYRSQAFEFISGDKLAGSVMKEIARTFEATRALVDALPWGIAPKPPSDTGFYEAEFYVTREAYIAAGGPANSGGVYFSKDRVFRIPFPSLGLEMRGKTWFKNESYQGKTIIHEITHQTMHDFLPFLPIWATEGMAEYTEMLPYNAGRFLSGSHERGLKDYLKGMEERGLSLTQSGPFFDHMHLSEETWHSRAAGGPQAQTRLYLMSCVLVYYFSHLDGDGNGARWIAYLDKIKEARDAWDTFFKNPQVRKQGDGGFSFPSTISVPSQKRDESFGLDQMSILLDGRNADQLQKDIVAAYKKIGIRW
jgi:hypothetical protein